MIAGRVIRFWNVPLLLVTCLLCSLCICLSLTSAAPIKTAPNAIAGLPPAAAKPELLVNRARTVRSYMPERSPEMIQYSRIRYAHYFVSTALNILFVYLFLQFGAAKNLARFAQSKSEFLFPQLAIFVLVFSSYLAIANFPLTFYMSYWLEHHYHLSDQLFFDWLIDRGKLTLLGLAIEIPLWWLLYTILRRWPRQWPLVLFAASIPIIFALVFAAPLLFDPLLNKFTLLPEGPLRAKIESLAQRSGLGNDVPVYVCDRSKQTNKANAYVTGIFGSARIVIWDTTLKQMPEDEVLSVVAHEIGHYVLKHVYWGVAIAVLVSLILVPVNMLFASRLFARLPDAWGVRSLEDIAGVPLIVLISLFIGFFGDPIVNWYSRQVEHEADAFGLDLTKDGPAFARSFVFLSERNLSDPDPPKFIELWCFSHPTLKKRIEFCLQQK